MVNLCVVIPTRNRPGKLQKCLTALSAARGEIPFKVHVCDSSDKPETRTEVEGVCRQFPFVVHHLHDGKNCAAARNACVRAADAELLVNVDDDVYVEPDAVTRLHETYRANRGPRVVAGSVAWGNAWSRPVVMRYIGYGRAAEPGEKASFLVGAFFLYPRSLGLAMPWNERIRTSDDRFMGAAWSGKGVQLLYEPNARAFHDDAHNSYSVDEQKSHIYANLFDALIANPNVLRFLGYEFLGFAAGGRKYLRKPDTRWRYLKAWFAGHAALAADWEHLRRTYRAAELPPDLQR